MHQKILFVCDDINKFNLHTDGTYALMVSAYNLNKQVFYTNPQDIYAINNQAYASQVALMQILVKSALETDIQKNWYQIQEHQTNVLLDDFDIILVRTDPPFNMEYYYQTQILSLVNTKTKVINDSYALRNFNEKLAILNFPDLISPTVVTKNKNIILEFLNKYKQCVIKPLDLMAGRSVFKISLTDVNYLAIIETLTNYYTNTIMLQEYIPEVSHGDKRIFVVGGMVIDSYLLRTPAKNQIRSNIAAGGTGSVCKIDDESKMVAEIVAKWLLKHNIHFAGLDIIGNKLNEINITSPTGMRQILNIANIDIAKIFLSTL